MEKRKPEELNLRREARPFADAQSLKQSSLRCGTRFVGAAEEPLSGRGSQSLSATSSRSDSPRFA